MEVIRPKKIFQWSDLREMWQYKELLYFFSWRDIKVRYKQTVVGVSWAVFQPFITMVVFSVFFGKLAGMPSDGVPYPIFVFAGLIFWQFFSSSLSDASNCLVSNQSIVQKIYFPRLILPVSATLTKLIDFVIAAVILLGMMVFYGYGANILGFLIFPLLILISFMAAVGTGLYLAAINVKYRDVRYAVPFFIQIMLFVTPVIYPPSLAGKYSWILALNPMTGVIKAARAALFNSEPINWMLLGISAATCFLLLAGGIYVFKKTEHYFADIA